VSAVFWEQILAEPLGGMAVLDVGTGWGRLALALAPLAGRVVGIDRDVEVIDEARRRAAAARLRNVEFVVADAETTEYAVFGPQMVVAHLCMSDDIAARAARALQPGQVLAFVAFHAEQWLETGRRSRFAYDEARVRSLLERVGFGIDVLDVEREVRTFASVEAALAAVIGLEERWRSDGRWFRYIEYLERGGRSLTRAHLVVKARRR
jgi:2-polyprenyl-3-methyl-5-hydroxy-6-metoxy-1,4-benzoquinol methylase